MAGNNRIAAGDKTTAESARIVLEAGGNAFDAAVAACFTAMIAEPTLTSAAGGGFLNAYPADGKPILFDFFVNTPSGDVNKMDFYKIIVDFGTTKQAFHIGKGSVAVPGIVAGLLLAHDYLGDMPIKLVMEPAIEFAKKGIRLTKTQAYVLRILKPIIIRNSIGQRMFAPEGELLSESDLLCMPDFADFLDVLTYEGKDLFYRGEVAKNLLSEIDGGGLIQYDDLLHYQVVLRDPLKTSFHGYTILGNPPPSLGGLLIDATLTLLEKSGETQVTPISLLRLVEAFETTNILRQERVKEPPSARSSKLTQQEFFKDYLDMYLSSYSPRNVIKSEPHSLGSTTHISILDRAGNAVSVTTTNGEGSGIFIPGTGIMLNNMLGEEDLNPEGFHQYNKGKRLSSMISPTIVMDKRNPVLITGSAGSSRILSVIVQIILNTLCNNMKIEEATAASRIHLERNVLHLEPGFPDDVVKKLEERYEIKRWEEQNLYFGGANSVSSSSCAGDPRRDGYALEF